MKKGYSNSHVSFRKFLADGLSSISKKGIHNTPSALSVLCFTMFLHSSLCFPVFVQTFSGNKFNSLSTVHVNIYSQIVSLIVQLENKRITFHFSWVSSANVFISGIFRFSSFLLLRDSSLLQFSQPSEESE